MPTPALFALLLSGCAACGVDPGAPLDAQIAMSAADLAVRPADLATPGDAARRCTNPPSPPAGELPAGWVHYPDWSCECSFWVPSAPRYMPKPIEWVPCENDPMPGGLACRWMKIDWVTGDERTPIGISPSGYTDQEGRTFLKFVRNNDTPSGGWAQNIVAEADGPVRSAIMQFYSGSPYSGLMWDSESSLTEGKVGWVTSGDRPGVERGPNGRVGESIGLLGGDLDTQPPKVLLKRPETIRNGTAQWLGALGIVERPGSGFLYLRRWNDLDTRILVATSRQDPDFVALGFPILRGDTIFFDLGSLVFQGVYAWTAATGARPLLRWPHDATRGASGFGADERDLVWDQSEGRDAQKDAEGLFPINHVYTAPFTSDPQALRPRRLRTSIAPHATHWYQVGCGYAARSTYDQGLFVVRLKDGHAWHVPTIRDPTPPRRWVVTSVATVTCDDVYAFVTTQNGSNLARIRIDSLGPGMAPD